MALLEQARQGNALAPPTQGVRGAPGAGAATEQPHGGASGGVGPAGSPSPEPSIPGEAPASPREQQEYDRARSALAQVIYGDDGTNASIVKALDPDNKVGSVAQTALLVLTQVDDKIDMDEAVVAQATLDTVLMLADVAEQAKGLTFDEMELKQAVAATWEGMLQVFGGDDPIAPDFEELSAGLSEDQLAQMGQEYSDLLDYGEGLGDAMSQPPTGIGPVSPEQKQPRPVGTPMMPGGGGGGQPR